MYSGYEVYSGKEFGMPLVVMNLRSPLLKFDFLQVATGIFRLPKLKYLCNILLLRQCQVIAGN
ncbi:hypothetical protein NIES4103_62290 [Nostoc sp. NIES-4103]|nr:hypothetical protein NIES4103_62290 [Nostoc sp. NIES-4103]